MPLPTSLKLLLPCIFLVGASCSHRMEVTNYRDYEMHFASREISNKVDLAVKPGGGSLRPANRWMYNAVVEKLLTRREIGKFSSDYIESRATFTPDFFLEIRTDVEYDTSGKNFFVNFPGGIVFAPAWNGYFYSADMTTTVAISSPSGELLEWLKIETPYEFKHSDFSRTWYPLFQFNILNVFGGIFTALVYDDDATQAFEDAVQENYSEYVTHELLQGLLQLEQNDSPPANESAT